jgi:hypothetical protein
MEDKSWQAHHAQITLAGTMALLPLNDEQRLGVSLSSDPWGIMIRFYYGLITDTKFGVGILPRIMSLGRLQDSHLVQLVNGLSDILSPERRSIHPSEFIGYRQVAEQVAEAARGTEQWYARSLMNLCEIFVTMMEKDHDHKFMHAQRIIVFLRSAARVEAVHTREEPPAAAEEQMHEGLTMLLLHAYESARPAESNW